MGALTVGLLHPGQMGAAIGAALVREGTVVHWSSAGRSPATAARAAAAGLTDAGHVAQMVQSSHVLVSVCPPHAAVEVAWQVAGAATGRASWIYVDANAISPATAGRVASIVEAAGATFVDGGIVGPPPTRTGCTRLYLSGPGAAEVSEILASSLIEIHILDDRPGSASALKLAYAAWTKGSAALLLAARAAAGRAGVEAALIEEWQTSQPGLLDRWQGAVDSATAKGWRWVGEMQEIAAFFESCGLPAGFHSAAAQLFEDPTTVA